MMLAKPNHHKVYFAKSRFINARCSFPEARVHSRVGREIKILRVAMEIGHLGEAWPPWVLGKVALSGCFLCAGVMLGAPYPSKAYARRSPHQLVCTGCGKMNMHFATCRILPGSIKS